MRVTSTLLAALTALALAAAPASANPFPHPHPFFGPHFHRGPWGGPGLVFGLAGAVIAAGIAANACVGSEPVYDADGNYRGQRPVNIC